MLRVGRSPAGDDRLRLSHTPLVSALAASRRHHGVEPAAAVRKPTGLIRATPLSEGPQSAALHLIAHPERSTLKS